MRRQGFTLVELLVAVLLLGLVLAGASSVYVAAHRFLAGIINNHVRVITPSLALETMARRARIANRAVLDAVNNQIRLRIDPARTPLNLADDVWVKYRFIGDRLRWRQEAAEAGDVTANDQDVEADLRVRPESRFALVNPSASGDANVLEIVIVTEQGTPPAVQTLRTSVAVTGMVKT